MSELLENHVHLESIQRVHTSAKAGKFLLEFLLHAIHCALK